jgi:hypothetical protein
MKIKAILTGVALAAMLVSCGGMNNAARKDAKAGEVPSQISTKGAKAIFNGKSFKGWRGYNREDIPSKWIIEDGSIKFDSKAAGEGGDIIYATKFKNFELTFDWKISKGGNSGVLYLGQEIPDQSIVASAVEYQILDNQNHPDAKLGFNGNRQSASLYDLIPANPQNAKPAGEWNTGAITVNNGKVTHWQNGEPVVEYNLWTPQWDDRLSHSKFSKKNWPAAYELMLNLGGENHEGYIAFQDHGDDVWYKNIKVKVLE